MKFAVDLTERNAISVTKSEHSLSLSAGSTLRFEQYSELFKNSTKSVRSCVSDPATRSLVMITKPTSVDSAAPKKAPRSHPKSNAQAYQHRRARARVRSSEPTPQTIRQSAAPPRVPGFAVYHQRGKFRERPRFPKASLKTFYNTNIHL